MSLFVVQWIVSIVYLCVQFFVLMLVAGILYLPRVLCNGQQLNILGIVATPVTSPTSHPALQSGSEKLEP